MYENITCLCVCGPKRESVNYICTPFLICCQNKNKGIVNFALNSEVSSFYLILYAVGQVVVKTWPKLRIHILYAADIFPTTLLLS